MVTIWHCCLFLCLRSIGGKVNCHCVAYAQILLFLRLLMVLWNQVNMRLSPLAVVKIVAPVIVVIT